MKFFRKAVELNPLTVFIIIVLTSFVAYVVIMIIRRLMSDVFS